MKNIEDLVATKNFEDLTRNYTVEDLVKCLSFEKAMILSKMLLENETWDANLQEYAIQLIEKIKQSYPKKWETNWKHEAYLGYAYGALGFDVEKEFNAYSTAAQKSINPPPIEILMHMALLWSYPGIYKSKIDEKEAIRILEHVAKKVPYREAVGGLIRLYEATKQAARVAYWKEVLIESEKKDLYDRHLYLNFFKDYQK